MKRLSSIEARFNLVLAAVSAVLLACAFSACGNPNGSSGGNNNSSQTATYLDGTYTGEAVSSSGDTYSFTFLSDGTFTVTKNSDTPSAGTYSIESYMGAPMLTGGYTDNNFEYVVYGYTVDSTWTLSYGFVNPSSGSSTEGMRLTLGIVDNVTITRQD